MKRTRAQRIRINMQLLGPLAVVDLGTALLVIVQGLQALALTREALTANAWFCKYFGVLHLLLPCVGLVLLTVIALDRYWLVVHERGISYTLGWSLVLVTAGTLAGLLVANACLNGSKVDGSLAYCRPLTSEILGKVTHRASSFTVLLGFIVVMFCYISIYLKCRKSIYNRIKYRHLLILIAYGTCWVPKFITSVWGVVASRNSIPYLLKVMGPFGFMFLIAINPCLVISFQATLRRELSTLFAFISSDKPLSLDSSSTKLSPITHPV